MLEGLDNLLPRWRADLSDRSVLTDIRRSYHTLKGSGRMAKAMELADEKEAIAQFGSSDSGASLGDILGAALKDKK